MNLLVIELLFTVKLVGKGFGNSFCENNIYFIYFNNKCRVIF